MNIEDIKKNYKSLPIVRNPNYYDIPKNIISSTKKGAEEFNTIYRTLILNSPYYLQEIIRTPSGGIKARKSIRFQYDIVTTKNSFELNYLGPEGMFRFIFNTRPEGISGSRSFSLFKKKCKDFGICLEDFAIMNGEEVKADIESPYIELYAKANKSYIDVHHLDLNSSYMAGIAHTQPELYKVIEDIYNMRKVDVECKNILTHTYGYMQSEWCKVRFADGNKYPFAYAHLASAAIDFNNRMIEELMRRLKASGRHIIATNTDGIWYSGKIYHDADEGPNLGQWKTDHKNCKIRFKSPGSYEYIEDGIYHPVVRGRTSLDEKKDRSEWVWGDIYNNECKILSFELDKEKGIIVDYASEEELYGLQF